MGGGGRVSQEVKAIVAKYGLKVVRIHTHIGSGSDPAVWTKISTMSINICKHFPEVTTLNLGGGYKVGRMAYEAHKSTDLQTCGTPVKEAMQAFAKVTKANHAVGRTHLRDFSWTFPWEKGLRSPHP